MMGKLNHAILTRVAGESSHVFPVDDLALDRSGDVQLARESRPQVRFILLSLPHQLLNLPSEGAHYA